MSGQLWCFRDITERDQAEKKIRHLAMHDSLTRLPNRAQFNQSLPNLLERAHLEESPLALYYLDIDRFKSVNDSLGHAVGDELLRQVATRLQKVIRRSDLLCRLGGDEFTIVASAIGSGENAAILAQKLVHAITGTYDLEGHSIYVSTSVGIAMYPENAEDANTLVRQADAALYRAKSAGRNQYQFAGLSQDLASYERLLLSNSMRSAIENEAFQAYYQPVYDLRTGLVTAVEALLRWPQPDGRLISPGDFIPLAEETGLIVPLGSWVLRQAIEETAPLRALVPGLRLGVNLSQRQLIDNRLVDEVSDLLTSSGLPPSNLVLELTENSVLQNPDHSTRALQALRDLGVGVALDDFGTGQSSLSHLNLLPITAVKIDRSFVSECTKSEASRATVAAVLLIAKARNLNVVAEGIETVEQEQFLIDLGCPLGQGFRYCRPAPIEQMVEFLEKQRARVPA